MPRILLAILAATLVLAGCSSEKTLSQDEVTGSIKTQYQEQTGTELTEITCKDIKAEVGAAVSCDATNADGVELTIGGQVDKVGGDGEKNDFTWQVEAATVPSEDFETAATDMIVQQMQEDAESVTCPDMIELKEGNQVDCVAHMADGSERDIVLELTDQKGGFKVIPK